MEKKGTDEWAISERNRILKERKESREREKKQQEME